MIIRTRTGVKVSGTLRRDAETKSIGSKKAFVLPIRVYSEKTADGQWDNYDVDVKIWGEHPELEEMFEKGDFITAEGREIEDRPRSDGKVYHNLTADDVVPGSRVILRWMQQQINICYEMIQDESDAAAISETSAPVSVTAPNSPVSSSELDDLERKLDETDEQDLPF